MASNKHSLWVEKYRPDNLNDYIFQSKKEENIFREIATTGEIPHLLLQGIQGSGKTTLAKILLKEAGIDELDIMIINASDERGIDTFRNKIDGFISSFPVGKYRVVLLEEADMLPTLSQTILRNPMEEYSETARFILTCNYGNKILPAIKSRCQTFTFKSPDKDSVFDYALDILEKESINPNGKSLENIIDVHYPDVRKIINTLQQNSAGGVLKNMVDSSSDSDYKFEILNLLETDNWQKIRKVICDNVTDDNDFVDIFRFLYDNISKSKKFSNPETWESAIVIIADHLYKSAFVAVQEINMAACLIKLSQV